MQSSRPWWTLQAASNAYSHLCPTRSFDGRNPQQVGRRRQDGDKMARYDMTICEYNWMINLNNLEYMFEHVADSEQTSVECLEGPDGSYLVASPFLISCLHWKPLRVQHLQERQPYNSSSLASKSSWKRFKSSAFPFFFTVSKSLECDVSIISHVVDAAIESLLYLCVFCVASIRWPSRQHTRFRLALDCQAG